MLIGPDAGDDDEILLPALEGVHATHFHRLIQRWLQRALPLHDSYDVASLTLVGRDDPYLSWPYSRF